MKVVVVRRLRGLVTTAVDGSAIGDNLSIGPVGLSYKSLIGENKGITSITIATNITIVIIIVIVIITNVQSQVMSKKKKR